MKSDWLLCLFILVFVGPSLQRTKLVSARKKLKFVNDVILPRMLEQTRRKEFLFYDKSRYNSNEKMEKHILREEEALLSKELDPILKHDGRRRKKAKKRRRRERKLSRGQLRKGVNVNLDNDVQLLKVQKKLINAEMDNIEHLKNRRAKKKAMKTLTRDLKIFDTEANSLAKYDPYFALGGLGILGGATAGAISNNRNLAVKTEQASSKLSRTLMEDKIISQQLGILTPILENLHNSKKSMEKTEHNMMFKLQGLLLDVIP